MGDHHSTPIQPRARKEHRCIYCGGPILVGEQYTQQSGHYDGAAYRCRYHNECFDDCATEARLTGDWEFTPHSADYPPRVKAIVDARRAIPTPLTGDRAMSNMEDVYQALVEGQRAADHLRNIARGVDAWDRVRSRERVLSDGMKAFERLRQEMARRPIYNEPPEDYRRTSCGCQDPGASPPCSWCTDPANNPD